MWSLKKIILGTLAVSGVATVGYLAYRYFTNRDDTKPEETTEEVEEGTQEEQTQAESVAEPAADQTPAAEQVEPEGKKRLAQNFQPIPRPKCLQHVQTMKDLEMTLEALAAYLFTQNLSEDELKEAQRELGWVWYAAVAYKSRLPQSVPLLLKNDNTDDDEWLPLQDELTGMQMVD